MKCPSIQTFLSLVRNLFLIFSFSMVLADNAISADLTLAWDANGEPVGGYKLYVGPSSGNYTSSVDVGNNTTYTQTDLEAGETYYFVVTAYNTYGESGYSNEVNDGIPAEAPVAEFSASPTSGTVPLTVNFSDASAGDIDTWSWDFGDGGTGTGQTPVYEYQTAGTYPVSLTVTGPGGTDTETKTNFITVSADTPETLSITTDVLPEGRVGEAYSATLAASGGDEPYTWSVVDGKLPPGLTLDPASGTISGTSSSAGTSSFTAQVSDAATPPQTVTKPLSVRIVAPGTSTIWDETTTPGLLADPDTSAVEVGVKFHTDVDGLITGIRFYKSDTNTGTHVGNLWSSDGQLLAKATFTNETDSGWQQVDFANPVAITANTVYVASYHTDVGHYSVDENFFAGSGVDNGHLHALRDGESGGNGVYAYGPSSFPTDTYRASNYWVDVVFTTSTGVPDTTPPTVKMIAPEDGSTVTGAAVPVSADADDNVGVASVQFLLDGVALGAPDTSAPYSITWDSTTVAEGSHTLSAQASDTAGNTASAHTVTVTVSNEGGADTTPPTVTMTAPVDGATVTGTAVPVSADADDDVGVASVQFLLDDAALGAPDTSAPYSTTWDSTTVDDSSHTLSAQASDAAGNKAAAHTITVTVSNGGGVDTTPPTVKMTAPVDGATVTGAAVPVSADADDDVGVASVQFLLDGEALGAPDTSAPYSITWDSTMVADGSTHTLSAQASDAAGNPATAHTVTVTVSNGGGVCATLCSLWEETTTPSVLADPDTNAVEVGVKFQADVDGLITGIRFYKSDTNAGTHVGSLWSRDGHLLAKATFTNETDSGWQQVDFAEPIAITANTVYVASYHTDVGQYSVDENYFANSGVDNGPLHALRSRRRNGNGVYRYGSSGFPTKTYRASNYWVDVVFTE
jgi:PKD repeat protein